LSDTATATQLWAETYERAFSPDGVFEIQDDLVPRIVSTCADPYGVLPRSISDVIRGTDPGSWSPYEALVHSFGYHQRLTPTDHLDARKGLEHAVEIAPRNADCWAMLSVVYGHEYAHGFNRLPNALERCVRAARRAVDLDPGNHMAHQALSNAMLFRKEIAACLHEADLAMALNPLDGGCRADVGAKIAFAGDWDRGCALIEQSMELNPLHPVWYRGILSVKQYMKANYCAAVDEAVKTNAPDLFWIQIILAAAHAQLGEHEAAAAAVRALQRLVPDFAANAGAILGTWFQSDDVEHFIDGLRKAGALEPSDKNSLS
jgi:tetratricopeptide (TPR) repeat protein